MLLLDLYFTLEGLVNPIALLIKWIVIIAFTSVTTTTHHFNISTMDVTAITALLSLLNPVEVLLSLLMLFLVGELLSPVLKQFGEAGAYPFLPIVLAVNIILIAFVLFEGNMAILGAFG